MAVKSINIFYILFFLTLAKSTISQYPVSCGPQYPDEQEYDPLPKWNYAHPVYEVIYGDKFKVPSLITPIEFEVGRIEPVAQPKAPETAETAAQAALEIRQTGKARAKVLAAVKKAEENKKNAEKQAGQVKPKK